MNKFIVCCKDVEKKNRHVSSAALLDRTLAISIAWQLCKNIERKETTCGISKLHTYDVGYE